MNLREKSLGLREILSITACVLIVVAGIATYRYVDTTSNQRLYRELIEKAQSIASLIDPEDIAMLSISEADLSNPTYQNLKEKMIELREKNTGTRFVYIMVKYGNTVYFVVDSEDPSSEDYSPPGQEYTEASKELLQGWSPNISYVLEIDADRWGHWISALAPIKGEFNETIALVGIDQDARVHQFIFLSQTVIIIFGTAALLCLVGVLYVLNKREQELSDMKTDFVAVASHELRSPLTAIRWDLSTLLKDPAIGADLRAMIDNLYQKVCALIELTNSFLLSTSVDHGVARAAQSAVIDITSLMREVVSQAENIARPKRIHIEYVAPANTQISVKGDRERLRLVFDNFLSNAVKYSPEGSVVSISYTHESKHHVFKIKDQGIGIPKEDLKKIFGGFHRASNARDAKVPGTGFGLYMVKKIVEAHDGKISCESEVNKGTTFTVILPAV